jgi:hypothetical protein
VFIVTIVALAGTLLYAVVKIAPARFALNMVGCLRRLHGTGGELRVSAIDQAASPRKAVEKSKPWLWAPARPVYVYPGVAEE